MLTLNLISELINSTKNRQKCYSFLVVNIYRNRLIFGCSSNLEAVVRWYSIKRIFLKFFEKFRENHLFEILLFRYSCRPLACNFFKKETPALAFPYEFCKIIRTPFYLNTSGWLLLEIVIDTWNQKVSRTITVLDFQKNGTRYAVYLNINLTITFACSFDLQILRVPEARMKSNI